MDTIERCADARMMGGAGLPAEPGPGALDEAREAAERFLRAADRAIAQALSTDSEAFLRASRQEGGE